MQLRLTFILRVGQEELALERIEAVLVAATDAHKSRQSAVALLEKSHTARLTALARQTSFTKPPLELPDHVASEDAYGKVGSPFPFEFLAHVSFSEGHVTNLLSFT